MTAHSIAETLQTIGLQAKTASALMAKAPTAVKNTALRKLAALLRANVQSLQVDNARDLERAIAAGLAEPMVDRLKLTPKVLETCAQGCEQLAAMPDVIGEIIGMKQQPSGIRVGQMRVPIGVFGMIFESRPNVTIEAASLSIKSGNACVLRGGSEAIESNKALARLVQQALVESGLPAHAVQLVQTTDREAVGHLITMPQYVDVIIPRGGKGLIERISRDAKVPVIKHLDGNCHTYVDDPCDVAMAVKVADNAKTNKFSPCNASEGLLVARGVAAEFLPRIGAIYAAKGVEMRGCPEALAILAAVPGASLKAATEQDWFEEYLAPGHQRQGREWGGRGHCPHQPLRQPPHRCDPHAGPHACAAVSARGGLGQRHGECEHPLRGRLRVRAGRRDRHQHRQVPRPRPGGHRRPDVTQVCGAGRR
jgi:glutamate-5-semialdehyde dehydrogenase